MKKSPAMRALKQARAVGTRAEIIEKAVRLFSQQGYHDTTMVDLARAITIHPRPLRPRLRYDGSSRYVTPTSASSAK